MFYVIKLYIYFNYIENILFVESNLFTVLLYGLLFFLKKIEILKYNNKFNNKKFLSLKTTSTK